MPGESLDSQWAGRQPLSCPQVRWLSMTRRGLLVRFWVSKPQVETEVLFSLLSFSVFYPASPAPSSFGPAGVSQLAMRHLLSCVHYSSE